MTTLAGGFGVPGTGDALTVTESEILWGSDQSKLAALWTSERYSGAARDAGNTGFTTVLRPGLIMGRVTSTGELEEWDADASDGTQDIAGVLDTELRMQDFAATNADRIYRLLVRAPIKARKMLIQGTALTSHIDEFLARRALHDAGFTFDDDPMGYKAGVGFRQATVTGTTDTLTEAENGTKLRYSSASAVTVTLPAIHPGLRYEILRTGDEELVVQSAEGNNLIVGNNKTTADKVTFTTASEHIGAFVVVEGIYDGTTPLWHVTLPQIPFGTNGTGLTYAIGTS